MCLNSIFKAMPQSNFLKHDKIIMITLFCNLIYAMN